jgi:hypothetical protein
MTEGWDVVEAVVIDYVSLTVVTIEARGNTNPNPNSAAILVAFQPFEGS